MPLLLALPFLAAIVFAALRFGPRLLELRGEAPMKDDVQSRRHRRRERTRKSEH